MITLTAMHVFPVKSCAPQSPSEVDVERRGLAGDRRWMVVDADGRFLTARKWPRMTLVRATPGDDVLQVDAPGMPSIEVRPHAQARRDVVVWGSALSARAAEAAADAWISAFLGCPAAFVYMDDEATRAVDPAYARSGDEVSFADGFPLLLIAQASLDGLNERLDTAVPMLRFRPNLVVAGALAHAEDAWRRIRIGAVEFDVVKPCTRCVLTTVDFVRGEFDPRGEPLRTLLTYRRGASGVTFGQNLIPRGTGTLRIGDQVDVLA